MKKSLVLAPFCLPLLAALPAHAAFNPSIVAGDAKWVVYVDMQGLRSSVLGKELVDTIQKQIPPTPLSGVQFDFQKFLSVISNVTAYGTNFSPKPELIDGALIIEGTGDLRKIAEGLAVQATLTSKDVTELTDLPFPAYALSKEVFIAFPPEPIVVIGKSKPQLIKARDAFRGNVVSLAQNSGSPLAKLVADASRWYAFAASVVPTDQVFTNDGPQARILQLVESGMIALGEENQRTVAQAQLNAKSSAAADKLMKIVQGMTAMMSLTETSDRQLTEFLQSAVTERRGQTVSTQVSYSSDRLVQMIQSLHETAQRKPTMPTPPVFGRVLEEWAPEQMPANTPPSAATLADHVIANVHLATGTTVTLTGQRGQRGEKGGNVSIDCVEVFPMSGGAGLRFEAENMRLRGYFPRNAPFASGGRMISHNGFFGSAQFEFPGADGDYMVKVRYLQEPAAGSKMAVSLKDPAPAPAAR